MAWLRRNAFWLCTLIGGTVFNIALQQGRLDSVPEWTLGVALFVMLGLFLYGVWHQPTVNKRIYLFYSRKPMMLLAVLMIVFGLVGVSFGAGLYFVVKRQPKVTTV